MQVIKVQYATILTIDSSVTKEERTSPKQCTHDKQNHVRHPSWLIPLAQSADEIKSSTRGPPVKVHSSTGGLASDHRGKKDKKIKQTEITTKS